MEIPEYKRCVNGHLLYDDEHYCVVCGTGENDIGDKMVCENEWCKIMYTYKEKFCPQHGNELVPVEKPK